MEYKGDPAKFKRTGSAVCLFIRLAVTGRLISPDMYSVMQILGKDRILARMDAMIEKL